MVKKGYLKEESDCFIYLPPKITDPKKSQSKEAIIERFLKNPEKLNQNIYTLPFQVTKPKEIYFRHINEMEGFAEYFFATPKVKAKIKKFLIILKETHGLKGNELSEVIKKHKISRKTYFKYKKEIIQYGLKRIATSSGTKEPGEIFYFFKEYYLSYRKYTADEARELAILKLENLIDEQLDRNRISGAYQMLRRLNKEYSKEDIDKYRTANFSEFDTEHIFKI